MHRNLVFFSAINQEAPFMASMPDRWSGARVSKWLEQTLPAFPASRRPSRALLEDVLDGRDIRFQEVALFENMMAMSILVETSARLCRPVVAKKATDRLIGVLNPNCLQGIPAVRWAVKSTLDLMREPLDLASFSASGDNVLESDIFWRTGTSSETMDSTGFKSARTNRDMAGRVLNAVADHIMAPRISRSILDEFYEIGGVLDGFEFDYDAAGRSAIMPSFTAERGDGADLIGVALRAVKIPVWWEWEQKIYNAVSRNSGVIINGVEMGRVDIDTKVPGNRANISISLAGIFSKAAACAAISELCLAMGREDMTARLHKLLDRLAEYGGRIDALNFNIASRDHIEMSISVCPRLSYNKNHDIRNSGEL